MIYVVCHSGYFNLGDELIPRAWIEHLTSAFPKEDIYIDTCNPGKSSILFRSFKNIIFTDTLWEISRECMNMGIDYVLNAEFLKSCSVSRINGLEVLSEASHVHMLGGGYLNKDLWFNYSIPITLSILKSKYSYHLSATGLGMEPVDESYYEIISSYMSNFDLIDTRDRQSYDRLYAHGLKEKLSLTCDDLFLSIPKRQDTGDKHDKRLIIAPQKGDDPQRVVSFCVKFIREYPLKNDKIHLLSFNAESDHEISNAIASCVGKRCIKYEFNDLWVNGFPIDENDIVFTTRFHAHLISSALGATGYAASVSIPYYDIKHNSLTSLGSGFDVIGMHDFHFQISEKLGERSFSNFSHKIDHFREMKLDIASKIYGELCY